MTLCYARLQYFLFLYTPSSRTKKKTHHMCKCCTDAPCTYVRILTVLIFYLRIIFHCVIPFLCSLPAQNNFVRIIHHVSRKQCQGSKNDFTHCSILVLQPNTCNYGTPNNKVSKKGNFLPKIHFPGNC